MLSRRVLWFATIGCLLVGLLGVMLYGWQRYDRCAYLPIFGEELLPNADLSEDDSSGSMPAGWGRGAASARYADFSVFPGGRSLQLIGIANSIQTPLITSIRPGSSYCFLGQAISDSNRGLSTRLQISFAWFDNEQQLIQIDRTAWQQVVLWEVNNPPAGWTQLAAAFEAPAGAEALQITIAPSSDDRVYLDQMHVRAGGKAIAERTQRAPDHNEPQIDPSLDLRVAAWPNGKRAAVSFSFDWETAMGGLIHSRSQGDPHADEDYLVRAMRMRDGITTTLEIFRPFEVRATYYATGYNFLLGNSERRRFMGDPIFAWATPEERWISGRWVNSPWFGDDPYGTVASHPEWYFGDLIPLLQAENQDIQSHTFSHLYGGLASPSEWQADLATWREIAAERGVAAASSLAFPWSSSAGMSDATWDLLEQAGIRSVTRLSDQAAYRLVNEEELRCKAVPGHERILACPDFYLTVQSREQAKALIDKAVAQEGMIDLWAHTEEVTSPEQIEAWSDVVAHAARNPAVWIAPLREIADWQQALSELKLEALPASSQATYGQAALAFRISNPTHKDMHGITLELPFEPGLLMLNGQAYELDSSSLNRLALILPALAASDALEVQIWPK